ncbi:hypothetical protein ACQUWN_14465 [Rossellomorea aquimaris]|uniref:hypothetical protein n=1 Tax=Rossellomorea TaxID=2837508 RepID=UPI001653794A|nr:hypothetical protein [Rossellomorea vietnamensis]
MVLFLVILTAAVYGLVMKYVLNNVFVTKGASAVTVPDVPEDEGKLRELIPAYNRQ